MKLLTDSESPNIVQWEDEWYGTVTSCTSCGTNFIMEDDSELMYCPHCGKPLKETQPDEAKENNE